MSKLTEISVQAMALLFKVPANFCFESGIESALVVLIRLVTA